jgi:hypothetical protein
MKQSAGVLFIGLLLLCSSVSATTDMQILETTYMPYQYEMLFIVIAFSGIALMKLYQELEVLFGLIGILSFGVAAWFAPYICFVETFVIANSTGVETLHTQVVTPQPVLQVLLVVCFLFAIVAELYVLFLRDADKILDSTQLIEQKE